MIVATDRARRPADFTREPGPPPSSSRYCPYCYGNESKTPPEILAYRTHGNANEPGWTVRVVPHKFPVLGVEGELAREGDGMFDRMNGIGAHEVIIETPEHGLGMAELPERQIEQVLWAYRARIEDLRRDFRLLYILLFKNHGEAAGATLDHAHSQLIALPVVPGSVAAELAGAKRYFEFKERCVYCDIVRQEMQAQARLVLESDLFAVIEPYAARFPFETWILPKRHSSHFDHSDAPQMQNLAWALRSTLRKLDKVLERPPFHFMIHTAPVQEPEMAHYHWHIEIIPKMTRIAGFEWGTGIYINPTPPEESAKFLRDAGLV